MFYVIGHDESGKLVAMTSKAFPTQEAADEYLATCNQGWTPFVVQSCPDLARLDALHAELREAREGESDDDTDFDVWVQEMADNNEGPFQRAAIEFLRLSRLAENRKDEHL